MAAEREAAAAAVTAVRELIKVDEVAEEDDEDGRVSAAPSLPPAALNPAEASTRRISGFAFAVDANGRDALVPIVDGGADARGAAHRSCPRLPWQMRGYENMLVLLLVIIFSVPGQAQSAFLSVVVVSTNSMVQTATAVVGGTLALFALIAKVLLLERARGSFCCFELCCRQAMTATVRKGAAVPGAVEAEGEGLAFDLEQEEEKDRGRGGEDGACVPDVGSAPLLCACCRPTRPPPEDIAQGRQGPVDLYWLGHEQRWGSSACWRDFFWTRPSNMVGRWMRLVWILIVILIACSLALYCIPAVGVYFAVVLVLPFAPVQKLLDAMIAVRCPARSLLSPLFLPSVCPSSSAA